MKNGKARLATGFMALLIVLNVILINLPASICFAMDNNMNGTVSGNEMLDAEEEIQMDEATSSGLSGTRTSTKGTDFKLSGKTITCMKKHGSSSEINVNYPYYLSVPYDCLLSNYVFSGDATKNPHPSNAEHVAKGCNYFTELYSSNASQAVMASIPEGAFYKCTGLKLIRNMPISLTTIDKLVFAYNTALVKADFNGTALSYIGASAFIDDANLEEALWSGQSSVGESAFKGCKKLKSTGVISALSKDSFNGCQALSMANIVNGINVPDRAFYGCSSLTGSPVVGNVGEYAFHNTKITDIKVNGNVSKYAFNACSNLKSVSVSGKIDSGAFSGCSNLSEVSLGGDVPTAAFSGLKGLTRVTLSNATAIGNQAFYNDSSLSNVDISACNSLQTIGALAFSGCNLKGGVKVPQTLSEIGEKAYFKASIPSVSFENAGTVNVGKNAFAENNITELDIKKAYLSDSAFADNPIMNITLANGITHIGAAAFRNKGTLKTLTVNGVPAEISDMGIFEGSSFTNVSLGNEVNKIQDYMFKGAGFETKSLSLGAYNQLTTIGKQAFSGAKGLQSVLLPDSVSVIDDGAFDNIITGTKTGFYVIINENSPVESVIKNYNASHTQNKINYRLMNSQGTVVTPVKNSFSVTAFYYEGYTALSMTDTELSEKSGKTVGTYNLITLKNVYKTGKTVTVNIASTKDDYVIEEVIVDGVSRGSTNTIVFSDNDDHTVFVRVRNLPVPEQFSNYSILTYYYDNTVEITGPPAGNTSAVKNRDYVKRLDTFNMNTDKTVQYSIKAKEGYEISSILVDGKLVTDEVLRFEDLKSHVISVNVNGKPVISVSETDKSEPFINECFNIDAVYYKQAVSVEFSGAEAIKSESVESTVENGNIISITNRYLQSTDGSKANITVNIKALDGYKINSVYIDGINKGIISSYIFNDEYNHTIYVNACSTEDQKEYQVYDPYDVPTQYYVDIVYHPESVGVSGPESTHRLFECGDYAFVRYYFTTAEKGKISHNFFFAPLADKKISAVYVDGKATDNLTGYCVSDDRQHLIVIESQDDKEIPVDVILPHDPSPLEPKNRTYDDDGNFIDKTKAIHKITYNLSGGINSPYNFDYYYEGSVFYFYPASKNGYNFKNWYNGNMLINSTKDKNKDIALRASFETIGYKISYVLNGGNFKNPSKVTYSYNINKTISLKKPVKEGYTFIGWFYGDTQIKKIKKNDAIKGNIVLVAKYTPNKYNIKFSSNNGKGKMNKITQCIYNKYLTLPKNEFIRNGYIFAGWNTKKNGTGISIANGADVIGLRKKGNVTLYAQWVKIS